MQKRYSSDGFHLLVMNYTRNKKFSHLLLIPEYQIKDAQMGRWLVKNIISNIEKVIDILTTNVS